MCIFFGASCFSTCTCIYLWCACSLSGAWCFSHITCVPCLVHGVSADVSRCKHAYFFGGWCMQREQVQQSGSVSGNENERVKLWLVLQSHFMCIFFGTWSFSRYTCIFFGAWCMVLQSHYIYLVPGAPTAPAPAAWALCLGKKK